ncbi:hypothetical protein GOHSU_24_00050 [Gordonia hirsuta DSM 44140 = NBRC 16056]|uniref:Low molecular weight protein antigen 6 PH domain-containing protein n=1 Tax=Gordonia hirsuta DSM 44140 = NBRC 16056 TaxID=1121927 RepID=L7LAD0_9ACTN|nr:PH domain-containing protein [Gordonia hirsuta]GAC57716.1 hypothetical protein GOHSU_24_00050 [Gordonia hirsuta DSM 44140 = NBRC 16056]
MNSSASAPQRWATPVPAALALLGLGVALAVASAASYTDLLAVVFLGIAAFGVVVAGVIALVRRPRLMLGPGAQLRVGTIRGPLTLTPADVVSIELLGTRRLAFRSQQLLIEDAGGRLLVFGRWDLGEDPRRVAEELAAAGFPLRDRLPGG